MFYTEPAKSFKFLGVMRIYFVSRRRQGDKGTEILSPYSPVYIKGTATN